MHPHSTLEVWDLSKHSMSIKKQGKNNNPDNELNSEGRKNPTLAAY